MLSYSRLALPKRAERVFGTLASAMPPQLDHRVLQASDGFTDLFVVIKIDTLPAFCTNTLIPTSLGAIQGFSALLYRIETCKPQDATTATWGDVA